MQFEVRFYFQEGDETAKPFLTFLEELANTQPAVHDLLVAGLIKLANRSFHGPPLTELVDSGEGIFELRVGRANIARGFFFFRSGRQIVVTNGYVKKRQKVDRTELDRARRYKRDWESRYP